MAGHVERRNGRYRARFRPRGGNEVSETFDRKVDANEWLDRQRGAQAQGQWIDPRAGRITFGRWAAQWRAGQLHHRESTEIRTESNLRNHLLTGFEDRPLASITRADVQAWVRSLSDKKGLAPATVVGCYRLLAQILLAAVEDRIIAVSPCRRINLPQVVSQITIPTLGQLELVAPRLPEPYRLVVPAVAGCGLRQGEIFGLTVDRVDWMRRTITVDRQLQPRRGKGLVLVEVKRPASNRVIPVGAHTLEVLAAHLAERPAGPDGLIFRSTAGRALSRSTWESGWERATRARSKAKPAEPDPTEECGARDAALEPYFTLHDVRHFYASLLIAKGLPVTVVAARLGHKDLNETLRTYAHLWPDDDDRTRDAVDGVLLAREAAASPRPGLAQVP